MCKRRTNAATNAEANVCKEPRRNRNGPDSTQSKAGITPFQRRSARFNRIRVVHAASVVLTQMGLVPTRCFCASVSRSRMSLSKDQFCRTLCWIRYRRRAAAAVFLRSFSHDGAPSAASFLKHKLWRIRNTGRIEHSFALYPAVQVVDREA